jgi:uncharacterized protein
MSNEFCHIELHTSDVEKAKAFFGSLLSWDLQDMEMGDAQYTMIGVGGDGTGGGMMQKPHPDAPTAWLPYVLVDDIDAKTAKVQELGGEVIQEKTEVPEFGWMVVIKDPTGAALGLWETMKKHE